MQMLAAIPAAIGGTTATTAATGASFLGKLATIGSVAGTMVGAYSQLQQGKYAAQLGKYEQNLANQRADQALAEGREKATRLRRENQQRMAAIRARMGGRGVSISDSALDFLGESARILETRVQDAWRYSTLDATRERQRGTVARWEGQQARSASGTRAFGTLLEGVGNTYRIGTETGTINPYRGRA